MEEIWKPIVCQDIKSGWYEVSNLGRVRHAKYKRLLSPFKSKGYMRIGLVTNNRGQQKFPVHRLVAMAFVSGYTKERHFVNHINGDKFNNTVENLEWVTASENTQHAIRTGLLVIVHGEQNGGSKLKESEVHRICKCLLDTDFNVPKTYEMIQPDIEISKTNIYHIKNKDQWNEITDQYFYKEDTDPSHPLHNKTIIVTNKNTGEIYISNLTRCSIYMSKFIDIPIREIHDKLTNLDKYISSIFNIEYLFL